MPVSYTHLDVYKRQTGVNLTGKLSPWVSAKDIILAVLRVMSVKGGVGKIVEYGCEGVKTLTVPERATITNMVAELGATTSVFPSDEITREFLKEMCIRDSYCFFHCCFSPLIFY